MQPYDPVARVLRALFELARDVEIIDVISLSERSSLTVYATLKALQELDERGLADRRRMRLTVLGLAAASALCNRVAQPRQRPTLRHLKIRDVRGRQRAA